MMGQTLVVEKSNASDDGGELKNGDVEGTRHEPKEGGMGATPPLSYAGT